MALSREEVIAIQKSGIDWTGAPLTPDGVWGARTAWWAGILTLPMQRQRLLHYSLGLHHRGVKEDTGRPNRSPFLDTIQAPGGIGPGNPWCIALVSHVMRETGVDWPIYHMSAYELIRWAKASGRVTTSPLPGDAYAFLYNPEAVGFTPGHGGILTASNADWISVCDGNVGDSMRTGKRAAKGLTYIRTVPPSDTPLIMPPLKDLPNLDGARTR